MGYNLVGKNTNAYALLSTIPYAALTGCGTETPAPSSANKDT